MKNDSSRKLPVKKFGKNYGFFLEMAPPPRGNINGIIVKTEIAPFPLADEEPFMAALSPWRLLICRLLGLLLLAAAVLKIYGLSVAPVAHTGLFAAVWFQVAVIQFELLLGLWLLSGKHSIACWLATTGTFTVFAAVSFYSGWIGQASCNCLGAVKVNPWFALAIDIVALGLLAFARPDLKTLLSNSQSQLFRVAVSITTILVGSAALLGSLGLAASVWFDSPAAALAFLRGEKISVWPALVDAGNGNFGETLEAEIMVTNWTDQPVGVFGGTFDCSCSVLEDLPITIFPGESHKIRLHLGLKAEGVVNYKAFLQTDCPQQPNAPFQITGFCHKKSELTPADF